MSFPSLVSNQVWPDAAGLIWLDDWSKDHHGLGESSAFLGNNTSFCDVGHGSIETF